MPLLKAIAIIKIKFVNLGHRAKDIGSCGSDIIVSASSGYLDANFNLVLE